MLGPARPGAGPGVGPSCAPCATQRMLQGCGEGCRSLWVVAAWSPGVRARPVSEHLRTPKRCWHFLGKPQAHSGTTLGGSSSPADGHLQAAVTALPARESEPEQGLLTSSAFCRPLKSLGGAAPLGGGGTEPRGRGRGQPGGSRLPSRTPRKIIPVWGPVLSAGWMYSGLQSWQPVQELLEVNSWK